jgi:hypothetical protein
VCVSSYDIFKNLLYEIPTSIEIIFNTFNYGKCYILRTPYFIPLTLASDFGVYSPVTMHTLDILPNGSSITTPNILVSVGRTKSYV